MLGTNAPAPAGHLLQPLRLPALTANGPPPTEGNLRVRHSFHGNTCAMRQADIPFADLRAVDAARPGPHPALHVRC